MEGVCDVSSGKSVDPLFSPIVKRVRVVSQLVSARPFQPTDLTFGKNHADSPPLEDVSI